MDCQDREFRKMVGKVYNECTLCHNYSKAPLRSIVSLPLALKLNECMCMNLKEIQHAKLSILYLIDVAIIFSAACIINSKCQGVVVSQTFRMWVAYFGASQENFQ